MKNIKFINSAHLKAVKGRYGYNKKKLQHVGTRSAHCKLRELSVRERRFVQDTNHVISKQIVNIPFNVIAIEVLRSARMKKKNNGRRFNHQPGSWSPYHLDQFKVYKAEEMEKTIIHVNPKFTSQKCSKCGYIHKNNREGNIFHCLNCNDVKGNVYDLL